MKSCVVIWFSRQQEIIELSSSADYLCLVEGDVLCLLQKKFFMEQGCICFVKIGECCCFVLFIFGVMDLECV